MKKFFLFCFSLFLNSLCFAQSEVIVGDMNQDQKISIADVSILVDDLLKNRVRKYRADSSIRYVDDQTVIEREYVDLGLPSGTLWATSNVGAQSPEDFGYFFAWGETTQQSWQSGDSYTVKSYKFCDGTETSMKKYCNDSYNGTVDNLTELRLEDDAAFMNWGSDWRMPSQEQILELANEDYTTNSYIARNGVYGRLITSKVNGNSIFIPISGSCNDGAHHFGDEGRYWSRTLNTDNSTLAHVIYVSSEKLDNTEFSRRWFGRNVRPVLISNKQHEAVDLGLSVNWATFNVGADNSNDNGLYFAWGETKGYTADVSDGHSFEWSTYSLCDGSRTSMKKYCTDSEHGTVDNKTTLEFSDDAAIANWGGDWRMPTHEEQMELISGCYWEWTSDYEGTGASGYVVYKVKADSDKGAIKYGDGTYSASITGSYSLSDTHIFLPAGGYRHGSELISGNGSYWSSSLSLEDTGSYVAWDLGFKTSVVSDYNNGRFNGRNVRAVCPK